MDDSDDLGSFVRLVALDEVWFFFVFLENRGAPLVSEAGVPISFCSHT